MAKYMAKSNSLKVELRASESNKSALVTKLNTQKRMLEKLSSIEADSIASRQLYGEVMRQKELLEHELNALKRETMLREYQNTEHHRSELNTKSVSNMLASTPLQRSRTCSSLTLDEESRALWPVRERPELPHLRSQIFSNYPGSSAASSSSYCRRK